MSKRNRAMNLFYIPALVFMLLFVAYPFSEAVRISFTKWNGYSQNQIFIGLDNYKKLFTDSNFHLALKNTLIYGFGSAFLQNAFGLAFAIFLNSKFKGNSIVRTIIYLPVMISGLIMGYIISFFVQYRGGVINEIIGWFGMAPIDYMASGARGVIIITLINSWQYIGISMIIYIAGLQNISNVYYEAAGIDGASKWQQFKNITVPLIIPAMSTAVVQNIIGSLKLYDVIISLSGGGPGFSTHSLSTYISNQYFKAQNAGYSAAVGIFTFLFIMIVATAFSRYFTQKEVEL
ncbi:raffinose/stachyose/melibiose transport system permease protein [Anaerocolumna jejuensis DSM 15929]|uniref:Raffinose/stachyose/melibiose transport system permease protein n=1 Tax=Anaerocolumna jejuensis DSM 15929 TaxID=1121322 RepID=A0A1M6XH48_9FIRM|nr:sugar ABC transporter permease [Anaerocolumna jejuensis]SHL05271.1 raffinose/stachyose/melibiose transport system permease protein [Anaerocolumna jejuensis DSM 15929]